MTRSAAEQKFDKLTKPRLVIIHRYGRKEHWYEYGTNFSPSVTGILRAGWPKPALVGWGIKTVAEWAANNATQQILYACLAALIRW